MLARSLQTEFPMLKIFVGLLWLLLRLALFFRKSEGTRSALHKARALYSAEGKRQSGKKGWERNRLEFKLLAYLLNNNNLKVELRNLPFSIK